MSYTPYYPGGWQPGPGGGTPISADALRHMDGGIEAAYNAIVQHVAEYVHNRFEGLFPLFSELDDIEICAGEIANAGAGWNSAAFPRPFEGPPAVMAAAAAVDAIVQVTNITTTGFQYRVRVPDTVSKYVSNGTSWSGVQQAIVQGWTTTADPVAVVYQAIYDGGDGA